MTNQPVSEPELVHQFKNHLSVIAGFCDLLLAELRRIAKTTGETTVSKVDIKRLGRVSHSAVVRRFGSLRKALDLAGLKSRRFMKRLRYLRTAMD